MGFGGGCSGGCSGGGAGGSAGGSAGGFGGFDPGRMGEAGWRELAKTLFDCRAVIVQEAGEVPRAILAEGGVPVVAFSGTVKDALRAVYGAENLKGEQGRCAGECGPA